MKHLRFEFWGYSKSGKTKLYGVFGLLPKENPPKLGEVKWYSRWRKYVFYPEPKLYLMLIV